jgi:inhibitor of KinA
MKFEFKKFGEKALLLQWPDEISEEILFDILKLKKALEKKYTKLKLSNAYNSLLIDVDYGQENISPIEIEKIYKNAVDIDIQTTTHTIPVCYEEEYAVDLQLMSEKLKIKPEQIVEMHSSAQYRVYFNGFLPGFMYLGGLNPKISIDRKDKPSLNIKAGSVAIGGNQTGVYPQDSPGGWYVIGQSPLKFFNPNSESLCIAKAGDLIVFKAISKEEFNKIKKEI